MNAPTRRPQGETARLGKEIYERDIRPKVEKTHHGKIVAIDVDTGDYAIGDMVVTAAQRLRDKRPDAVNVLSERVGYPTLRSFGDGSLARNR